MDKIKLDQEFRSHEWLVDHQLSGVTIESKVLELDPDWHVSFTARASSPLAIASFRAGIQFRLKVERADGRMEQAGARVSNSIVQWLSLNGGAVPDRAVLGGTQKKETEKLYLCRVRVQDQILPGKLLKHYNDSKKSICFTSDGVQGIESQSSDAKTMLYPSDVLVIHSGSFNAYFDWVTASGGSIPAEAVVAGRDASGQPYYSCRNQEGGVPPSGDSANDPNGEPTPGLIKAGAGGCTHEFYGTHLKANYQVLVWKNSGIRALIDATVSGL